jgi:hypothetical protein
LIGWEVGKAILASQGFAALLDGFQRYSSSVLAPTNSTVVVNTAYHSETTAAVLLTR